MLLKIVFTIENVQHVSPFINIFCETVNSRHVKKVMTIWWKLK